MIEIDSEKKWDDFCKMKGLKLLMLTGLLFIKLQSDELKAQFLSSQSYYQKLIKPCTVKWCGICKQLKKKLLKLYSMNDLVMASVNTELIPSLRDELQIRLIGFVQQPCINIGK